MCMFCSNLFCSNCDASPSSAGGSAATSYRYTRSNFGPLPYKPLHYDLNITIPIDDSKKVYVTSRQCYKYYGGGEGGGDVCKNDEIIVDADNLSIAGIYVYPTKSHTDLGEPPLGLTAKIPDFVQHCSELDTVTPIETVYVYDTDNRQLRIKLNRTLIIGEEVVIKTVSTCEPNDEMLEGIYYDFTPPGKPQTMITQCQQYGFQRIVPSIDSMLSKTFFTTTITADARYTNIVSNGDLAPLYANDAKSVLTEDGKSKKCVYYNHKVNMSPYLFFLGVGTYETKTAEVEYPSGQSFVCELLCLPGVVENDQDAVDALTSLVNSIIWVHLSTGPEKYDHDEERYQIYNLLKERDIHKASKSNPLRLEMIRSELKALISAWTHTGYTYTGKTYREIAMENSNYGGMENVGNTTILSSRLTPSRYLVDGGYLYMEGVKVHEYYHNLNGSQVTGSSPFEIWLNEAVTVHIQREREDVIFGHDFMRLQSLIYARRPGVGPLALDASPSSMAIEPIGFNTTHELISAMTYSKAPEFVRMTQSILGKEKFVIALNNYHTKYAFSNATSDNWVDCMCEYSPENVDLRRFAEGWLKRTGYPTVIIESWSWNEETGQVKVKVRQTGFEKKVGDNKPWIIPIDFSAVSSGANLAQTLYILQDATAVMTLDNVNIEPDFISVGRDFSFFGEVQDKGSTDTQQFLQAMSDPDSINRYLAFQAIADREKSKIVTASTQGALPLITISKQFLQLIGTILSDSKLSDSAKGAFLNIDESISSMPALSRYYRHLDNAKTALLQGIYDEFGEKLEKKFVQLRDDSKLDNRGLKFALFSAIKAGLSKPRVLNGGVVVDGTDLPIETGRSHAASLIAPLMNSEFMSDKSFALKALLELGGNEAITAHKLALDTWIKHPIGCEQYIAVISSLDCKESCALVRGLMQEPFFKISQSGHARTVARGWASNRKTALLTAEGLKLTVELFLKIGKVNEMSAYGFISSFDEACKFEGVVREKLLDAVLEMKKGIDKKQNSLLKMLERLLKSFEVKE